ncbi:uncharacterized protein LOC124264424 [Haliotis rubra]|uniref:uncharacterized protein LOC124264424 n=1 Tax=Haliotis rubra TaxID=36100 RepID=UPI001EE4FD9D|nr:uncharacterized protein LOC124264424 [Haliotis rubra]
MFACRMFCLLKALTMAILIALESSSALIVPTSDVNPICKTTTETLIPYPTNCARYYNCSAPAIRRYYPGIEKNLQECDYPQLYNPDTHRCEHYSMVQCGSRFEPLDACEYDLFPCSRQCGPGCDFSYPSCRNFADGAHADKYKPDTSFYHVCFNQRLVFNGRCPSLTTGPVLFNATLRMCVAY